VTLIDVEFRSIYQRAVVYRPRTVTTKLILSVQKSTFDQCAVGIQSFQSGKEVSSGVFAVSQSSFTGSSTSGLNYRGIIIDGAFPFFNLQDSDFRYFSDGAVDASDTKNLTISRCAFVNNTKSAIRLLRVKEGFLDNSTFFANQGNSGGAISIFDYGASGDISVMNSYYFGNGALNGGAIFSQNVASLTVINSSFKNNIASVNGGAIFLADGPLTLSAGWFTGNSASTAGGAVSASGGTAMLNAQGSRFEFNKAQTGGNYSCAGGARAFLINCASEGNIGTFGGCSL